MDSSSSNKGKDRDRDNRWPFSFLLTSGQLVREEVCRYYFVVVSQVLLVFFLTFFFRCLVLLGWSFDFGVFLVLGGLLRLLLSSHPTFINFRHILVSTAMGYFFFNHYCVYYYLFPAV